MDWGWWDRAVAGAVEVVLRDESQAEPTFPSVRIGCFAKADGRATLEEVEAGLLENGLHLLSHILETIGARSPQAIREEVAAASIEADVGFQTAFDAQLDSSTKDVFSNSK